MLEVQASAKVPPGEVHLYVNGKSVGKIVRLEMEEKCPDCPHALWRHGDHGCNAPKAEGDTGPWQFICGCTRRATDAR